MVVHLLALKWRLVLGGMRRSTMALVGTIVGGVYGLAATALACGGLVALRFAAPDVAGDVVVALGALLVAVWALAPLLGFGIDQTLDPVRFAVFGMPRRLLLAGLLCSGFIGIPGVLTVIVGLGVVVATATTWPAAGAALVAVPLGLLTCVASSRLAAGATAGLFSSRRWRDVAGVVAMALIMLAVVAWVLVPKTEAASGVSGRALLDGLGAVAAWLAFTPLGAAWAVPSSLAAGHWAVAAVQLAIAAATLAVLLRLWAGVVGRVMTDPPRGTAPARRTARRASSSRWPFDRLPATPTLAVAERCLVYWRRDPRYLVALPALAIVPVVLAVAARQSGHEAVALLGPVAFAVLLGWSVSNDVATDHTAFALHVIAGLPGRADRIGRCLAVTLIGVPPLAALLVAVTWWTGLWAQLPAALGTAVAAYLAALGVSSVTSVSFPYPVAEPGANPFQTPQGTGFAAALVQTVSLAAVGALTLPALVPGLLSLPWPWLAWVSLAAGCATGPLWLWLGLRWGGRIYDRRAPELLAGMRRAG